MRSQRGSSKLGLALLRSYEKNPNPPSKSSYPHFPTKKLLHEADLALTSGAGQLIADKLKGKKVSRLNIALATIGGGKAGGFTSYAKTKEGRAFNSFQAEFLRRGKKTRGEKPLPTTKPPIEDKRYRGMMIPIPQTQK